MTECDAFFAQTGAYYFEKSPTIFEYIVDFYITGKQKSSCAAISSAPFR